LCQTAVIALHPGRHRAIETVVPSASSTKCIRRLLPRAVTWCYVAKPAVVVESTLSSYVLQRRLSTRRGMDSGRQGTAKPAIGACDDPCRHLGVYRTTIGGRRCLLVLDSLPGDGKLQQSVTHPSRGARNRRATRRFVPPSARLRLHVGLHRKPSNVNH
jgi:hypothetical protein